MTTILNFDTAAEYVRDWHARCGEDVAVVFDGTSNVDGVPILFVTASRLNAEPAHWTVWIECDALYGEW